MEKRTPSEQLEIELEKRIEGKGQIQELKRYLNEKLYFQYLESSLLYISNETLMFNGNDMFDYLTNAIIPLKNNLDPLKLAIFVGEVLSRSSSKIESNIELLKLIMGQEDHYQIKDNYTSASLTQEENMAPKQEIQGDLYLRCLLAFEYSKSREYRYECEDMLEFLTKKLDSYKGVEASILGLYHRSYASYEKTMNKMNRFYKQMMLYLSFTPLSKIPIKEKPLLVYELIMSAVVSEDIYNLGELVLHPIVLEFSSIIRGRNTEIIDESILRDFENYAWILEVLVSLHEGDIDGFMKTIRKYQDQVNNTPLSSPEAQICVTKKTTTLALMDLAFRKNKNERVISFNEIAKHCRISVSEIELLVMKAINMNLIKGFIDQVSQTVEINWVHSRVLDKTRMQLLREKMDNWISSTTKLVTQLENIAPELVNC